MPNVNITINRTTASGNLQMVKRDYRVSTNSPRDANGNLKLRSNPHTRVQTTLVSDRLNGADLRSHPWGSGALLPSYYALDWANLESRSYASFRRKLYSGSASLGVTLGGYKQSREMIVKRFHMLKLYSLATLSRTVVQEAMRDGKKLKPKDSASLHLEVIFGWVPLLQDIHAAATTVIQTAPAYAWVKSSAKSNQSFSNFKSPYHDYAVDFSASYTKAEFNLTHSRGAEVTVSNPNVWLAERAGLLNPVSVAWDLVPWSFVVNMFLNTGQLVNSITDYAGLDIRNGWATKKARGVALWHADKSRYWQYPGRDLFYVCNEKHTTTNAVSVPPLVFKIPEANWELAAMAGSLFSQKFAKIAGLINLNHRT